MADHNHPALERLLRDPVVAASVRLLSDGLAGADLTTVLLDVARRRAASLSPAQVMAQYRSDRFVQPGTVEIRRLIELEMAALDAVAARFEPVLTSPLAPLGTHSTVADVHQDRVVTTMRGTEVAADPTNSLALEAACRRQDLLLQQPRSNAVVSLATVDRVVRAQRFEGTRSFPHFSLLGLVSAGRDRGSDAFESEAMLLHLRAIADVLACIGPTQIIVRVTDFSGRLGHVAEAVVEQLTGVAAEVWPDRVAGGSYYPSLCCKVSVVVDGEEVEVGDGGVVDWTQRLLGNGKERLMISGVSLERLAMLAPRLSGS